MLVWPEAKGWPQDIGALAILDGGRLLDADGRVLIEAAREHIGRRLHLVPRFRQLLCVPSVGLGWPLWVDAPSVDVAEHVGVFPVAPPGGDTEVLRACETLRRRPLPRSRPLWEMWFLPGLPDGRVGLFMKMHHAIADGVAGVATLGAFVDTVPDPPETTAPPWTPAPMPIQERSVGGQPAPAAAKRPSARLSALAHPIGTFRRMRRAWPAMRETVRRGTRPADAASTVRSARIAGWRSSAATSVSPRRSHTPTTPRSTTSC